MLRTLRTDLSSGGNARMVIGPHKGMDQSAASLIVCVRSWAKAREDTQTLVGSHPRGDARPDSDVDFGPVCRGLDGE
jgi:hypothetical protein